MSLRGDSGDTQTKDEDRSEPHIRTARVHEWLRAPQATARSSIYHSRKLQAFSKVRNDIYGKAFASAAIHHSSPPIAAGSILDGGSRGM